MNFQKYVPFSDLKVGSYFVTPEGKGPRIGFKISRPMDYGREPHFAIVWLATLDAKHSIVVEDVADSSFPERVLDVTPFVEAKPEGLMHLVRTHGAGVLTVDGEDTYLTTAYTPSHVGEQPSTAVINLTNGQWKKGDNYYGSACLHFSKWRLELKQPGLEKLVLTRSPPPPVAQPQIRRL